MFRQHWGTKEENTKQLIMQNIKRKAVSNFHMHKFIDSACTKKKVT